MSTREDHWLNRTVWGLAWTSFLSDLGHEGLSSLLPALLAALGLPPLALGAIEGITDAASSLIKLGAGWISDRLPRRKPFVVAGYAATGLASGFVALAHGFPLVFGGKLFGWAGKGIRGPLRDALMTDAIPPEARGRAFGFHRMGDTVGAILGPLLCMLGLRWMLGHGWSQLPALRALLWWTLLPGLAAAVVIATVVKEDPRATVKRTSLRHALSSMPPAFRRYLVGVGLFGSGDFARTLLILAAAQLMAPAMGTGRAMVTAGLFFVLHNAVYAAAAYPAGALADRLGHRPLLAVGYALFLVIPISLMAAFHAGSASPAAMASLFCVGGLVNGIQDTLEGAATAELVPAEHRGLGFGLLGSVNGLGDLLSSLVVGALWTANPELGFGFSALMAAIGTAVVAWGAIRKMEE